jgi:hypothetical protein
MRALKPLVLLATFFVLTTAVVLLLDRARTIKQLSPPLYREYKDGTGGITVYGRTDEWLKSVYDVLPEMVQRGRAAFGSSTPHISFYMFDQPANYMQFFKAVSGSTPRDHQAGTGMANMVLFCQFEPDGRVCGPDDLTWRRGCVLHEYGHALCNTVYGDSYVRDIPPWLNEGLADLLAKPLFGVHFAKEPADKAREFAHKGESPPTYDQLCHQFYEHGDKGYILAKLMIARLFAKSDISAMGRLIARAREKHGDFEAAIRDVFGVEPKAIYDETVATCWKK